MVLCTRVRRSTSLTQADAVAIVMLTHIPGKLELITWEWTDHELRERMGWGNVPLAEVADHRRTFEVDCRGRKSLFFKRWPEAFRWTCCGMSGSMNFGCDHHGTGSKPCTCDFCRCVVLRVFGVGGA